jgi:hypothetical protein
VKGIERQEFVETIARFNIPRVVVAALAGVYAQDVSAFTAGVPISAEKIQRITATTRELVSFIQHQPYPPAINSKQIDVLREAVGAHRLKMIAKFGARAAFDWAGEPEAQETSKVGE